MAIGDVTYDQDPVKHIGSVKMITGTLIASSTASTAAVLPTTNHILSASLVNMSDDDTYIRAVLNSDDGTVDTAEGSLYVQTSSAGEDTFAFQVTYK